MEWGGGRLPFPPKAFLLLLIELMMILPLSALSARPKARSIVKVP